MKLYFTLIVFSSLFFLFGCNSGPIYTTEIDNPKIYQQQKDMINRINSAGNIYYNVLESFCLSQWIPQIENGTVVMQKLDDDKNWKDAETYIFENNIVQDFKKRSKSFSNKYNENGELINSGPRAYTYVDGRINTAKKSSTNELYTYSYPKENCVEVYHKSSKTDFQMKRTQCKDSADRVIQTDEYVNRDGGKEGNTLNRFVFEGNLIKNAIYQEFEGEKQTRDVIRHYDYNKGLLIKETAEAKILKLSTIYTFQYKILQIDPLQITKYIKKGSKPLSKLNTFKFDNEGKLIEFTDHRADIYSRRFRYE